MRIVINLTFLFLLTHAFVLYAQDADELREKGVAALKESQSNPRAIVEAARSFVKASELYVVAGNEEKAVEMNSFLYWCKKKMAMEDIDTFVKGGETSVSTKLNAIEKLAPKADEAQAYLDRADQFAKKNPNEHLLIAIRFYEVADRFKGTALSLQSQDRSLKEQVSAQSIPNAPAPVELKASEPQKISLSNAKQPFPDEKAQKSAEQTIKDIFKVEYGKRSPADKQQLAQKLMTQGLQTGDDFTARYVLFREASSASIQAGDPTTALKAIDELSKTFAVDSIVLKSDTLAKIAPAATALESSRTLLHCYMGTIEECMGLERFNDAIKLVAFADSLARRVQDATVVEQLKTIVKDARDFQNESLKFKSAEKVLTSNPNDPAANLTAGRYVAFVKGDWDKGSQLLAKSNGVLKGLAEKELAASSDAKDQAALGDGWFELAQKPDIAKIQSAMRSRASIWYQKALPAIGGGLLKAKIEKRLEEIGSSEMRLAPGPKLSDREREALILERKELLEKAKSETNNNKQADLLIKAAIDALKLGNVKAGVAELDKLVAENGDRDYGDVSAKALLAKGKFFSTQENWVETEASLAQIYQKFKGSYGNSGCEAALIMAKHYEVSGDQEKAMAFHDVIIDCGGSYGDAAAASCMWFADYYVKHGDKAKALLYLNKIVDKYNGSYGNAKKAAEAKIKAIEK